jgi:hypothetical protein
MKMTEHKNYINVADDFSDDPFGRYIDDGDFNATIFRTMHLIPKLKALKDNEKLTVDFTGVSTGLGSSFVEEAFGGLVREGFSKEFLFEKLVYIFPLKFYEVQAKKFIAIESDRLNKV